MGHLVVELLLVQQTVHLKQKKVAMATVQIKKNELRKLCSAVATYVCTSEGEVTKVHTVHCNCCRQWMNALNAKLTWLRG